MPQWTYTADIEDKERDSLHWRGVVEAGFPKEGGLNQLVKNNKECPIGKVEVRGGLGNGIPDKE